MHIYQIVAQDFWKKKLRKMAENCRKCGKLISIFEHPPFEITCPRQPLEAITEAKLGHGCKFLEGLGQKWSEMGVPRQLKKKCAFPRPGGY